MAFTCSDCSETFGSAGGVTQHVALHHRRCAQCNDQFKSLDALREHIHADH